VNCNSFLIRLKSYTIHRKVFSSVRRTSAILQGAALMWEVKNLMNLRLHLSLTYYENVIENFKLRLYLPYFPSVLRFLCIIYYTFLLFHLITFLVLPFETFPLFCPRFFPPLVSPFSGPRAACVIVAVIGLTCWKSNVPSFDHCSPGRGDAGPTVGTLGQELQDRKIKHK
jgi:hypothetical protein